MKTVKFMTSNEKQLVLRAWVRFLKNGFKYEHFTKKLYNHLIMYCSFIAHYNRDGFYQVYFKNSCDTIRFLKQFDDETGFRSTEYGSRMWYSDPDYNDLNAAMCEEFKRIKWKIFETMSGGVQ